MKDNKIITGLFTLFLIISFASCELETSDNGNLDGFWHLIRIDTLSTGGSSDLSKVRRFWAVQHKLINMRDADQDALGVYCRFDHKGDSLHIYQPYFNHWHQDQGDDGGDIPISEEQSDTLKMYGLSGLSTWFKIDQLTGSRMILTSKDKRLFFKKQ